MLNSIKAYNILIVDEESRCKVSSSITEFWLSTGMVDDQTAKERVHEVVAIILSEEAAIIGVSTAIEIFYEPLKCHMFLYRCLIQKQYRAPALDTLLFVKTKEALQKKYLENQCKAVGILVVVQTDFLKAWNKAVWPETELVYIGNTKAGNPARIAFFNGARL